MKTVKEVSDLSGVSVRKLHYYDKIDLLKPTAYSDTGYRYYDDQALQKLQQILFFKEFDMPLKEIKNLMDNPSFDKEKTLRKQKQLLQFRIYWESDSDILSYRVDTKTSLNWDVYNFISGIISVFFNVITR